MTRICIAFAMEEAKCAYKHIDENWETVTRYGDAAYGHELYVWDDGCRILGRCRECGAFILKQVSEYHGMEDDDYYVDYFPVADPEEADRLNRQYDGFAIERAFPHRYLMKTNGRLSWSRTRKEERGPEERKP